MKLRLLKILLLSLAAYASVTTLGSELPDESSQGSSAGSDAAAGPSAAAAVSSEEGGETKAAAAEGSNEEDRAREVDTYSLDQFARGKQRWTGCSRLSKFLGRREVAGGAWALGHGLSIGFY